MYISYKQIQSDLHICNILYPHIQPVEDRKPELVESKAAESKDAEGQLVYHFI